MHPIISLPSKVEKTLINRHQVQSHCDFTDMNGTEAYVGHQVVAPVLGTTPRDKENSEFGGSYKRGSGCKMVSIAVIELCGQVGSAGHRQNEEVQ